MNGRLLKFTRFGLVLYALALLSLPILWSAFGERHELLILLRYMPAAALFVPIVVLLLPERDPRVWLASTLLLCWMAFYFLGLELPFRAKEESSLSVMTYNIKAGLEGPQELGRYLAEQKVDIICLQEARPPVAKPDVDPVDAIVAALPDYQMARGGIRGELVILSKYRILSMAERDLAQMSYALEARVDVSGEEVRVLNVHLMTGDPLKRLGTGDRRGRFAWLRVTAETRRDQFGALSALLSEKVPTVLTGDFNTPPNSDGHTLLSLDAVDCFESVGAGLGYTYPVRMPVWRIDYLWSTEQLSPSTCRVLGSALSDHRPIVAHLDWVSSE